MRDPREGVTADGYITTGASLDRVAPEFGAVIAAARAWFADSALPDDAQLLLYGSVATGEARVGESDVDLLTIALPQTLADDLSSHLSQMFETLCRGVEVAAMQPDDLTGDDDAAYGNRAFVRHYCVPLAGADGVHSGGPPFRADARAARAFNGDIATHLDRWRTESVSPALARRAARKSLLAAASLHSVLASTWTTDRGLGAQAWKARRPDLRGEIDQLDRWAGSAREVDATALPQALTDDGVIGTLVQEFSEVIGLWR